MHSRSLSRPARADPGRRYICTPAPNDLEIEEDARHPPPPPPPPLEDHQRSPGTRRLGSAARKRKNCGSRKTKRRERRILYFESRKARRRRRRDPTGPLRVPFTGRCTTPVQHSVLSALFKAPKAGHVAAQPLSEATLGTSPFPIPLPRWPSSKRIHDHADFQRPNGGKSPKFRAHGRRRVRVPFRPSNLSGAASYALHRAASAPANWLHIKNHFSRHIVREKK